MQNPEINNKKCYNCGKEFRDITDLQKHKNRKTPCLIREVAPENRENPLRCIFCNKIFSRTGNLNKHLRVCKIKNGGMEILDEKVRYEQEIRILKEENLQRDIREKQKDDELIKIREQMLQMQEKLAKLEVSPQVVNNTVNNIGSITNNHFHFYNYDNPSTKNLKITQDDLLVENIAKKMIELIYFNKDFPANHTIYLPNIKEKRLLMYRNNTWEHVSGNAIPAALVPVKNAVYTSGSEKVNSIYATDEDFERLYPAVKDSIRSFNRGEQHAQCSDEEIMEIVKSKRDLVAQTLRQVKVI